VSFEVGNGRDLSNYPDRTFDLVFSYITFQHIPDPVLTLAYIREAGRVLRPGGHFYFQVNNARPPGPWGRLRTRAGRLLRRAAGGGKRDASGGRTRKGGAGPVDKSGPRGLDSPAWVGSRVGVEEIRRACAQGGMDVETLRGEGTQYLWVRARRKRAAAGSTS
jgi:SAM-dependent methyltransferase